MRSLWVCGASSGIGKATAELAQEQGHWDRIWSTGQKEADVTDTFSLRRFVQDHGPFDDVVFCAGVNKLAWIEDHDSEDTQRILDVNLIGFMRLMSVLASEQSQGGAVVAVTSDAAERPMRTSTAYCASKAALNMAVKCLARELNQFRINAVAPGMTHGTAMQEYIDGVVPELRNWDEAQARQYEVRQIPLGRRATTREIANAILLTLEMPDYMTGSIVTINGGRS